MRLAFTSRKAEAEQFTDWIASEVLPSIRKTGGYSLSIPKTLPEALRAHADEVEKREEVDARTIIDRLDEDDRGKTTVIADVVESMASHRPYRAALGIDVALEEIGKSSGTLYDNTVADACLRLCREKLSTLKDEIINGNPRLNSIPFVVDL